MAARTVTRRAGSVPALLGPGAALVALLTGSVVAPAQLVAPAVPAHATEAGPRAESTQLTISRLRYDGGGDWYANPSSLGNLLREIGQRTGIQVSGAPGEVGPADPDLADHPYLYATGHGNMLFSDFEVSRLREHLHAGGFLHVDDNYGMDESFRREIARIFPDHALVEVPLDHPVYHIFYELPEGLPKIHEHDGEPARGYGIFLDGRLAVYYSNESDLGDGWEDAAVHNDLPEVREAAFQMGVNLFLYALASGPGGGG